MNDIFQKRKTILGKDKLKKISKSTLLVIEEAEKLGISWEIIPYTAMFRLQYKNTEKYFYGQVPSETTAFAHYCCKDKRIAKHMLQRAGISVTHGFLLESGDAIECYQQLFDGMKKPLVIKPISDERGNNVHLNLNSFEKFQQAIMNVRTYYGEKSVDLLIEEMFIGEEFRILATQAKVLSIIKRVAANVIGNGKSTIHELIKKKNTNTIRQSIPTYHELIIDDEVISFLKNQNLTPKSIPKKNEQILLRPQSAMNVSLGGDTIDLTDSVHPSVLKIALKTIRAIPGLALCGIDFMSKNIFTNQNRDSYKIIEINSSPSLDWNQYPLVGKKKDVAQEFLRVMFPEI
ncbi:MAG: hypothetical protein BroJett025_02220 [Patescibacteria group bacterium]|nr:MAG: hypothetical protein BroJett025_02220 [Patescibacteria group bacterium]